MEQKQSKRKSNEVSGKENWKKAFVAFEGGHDVGNAATLLLTTVLRLQSQHNSNSAPNSPLLGNSLKRKHQLLIVALPWRKIHILQRCDLLSRSHQ